MNTILYTLKRENAQNTVDKCVDEMGMLIKCHNLCVIMNNNEMLS